MKTNRRILKACATTLALAGLVLVMGDAAAPTTHNYPNGFSAAMRIGESLYQALPDDLGNQVAPRPVSVSTQDEPFIDPVALKDEDKISREVSISEGMIDLMNHLSHAKAVDRLQPGFFSQYVRSITLNGTDKLNLPEITGQKFWTETMKNEQMSYFNQMVSVLMAINLSHHYLGHYAKYADKLPQAQGEMLPINQFLSPEEWESSVQAGAMNSLSCAMVTSGARALFEAIDSMPQKPAWAVYIVPPYADVKSLNKELADYEEGFLHGKKWRWSH